MNRSPFILLGALVLGVVLFAGSFAASRRICEVCVAEPPGSPDWMQKEFHLNNDEMARIQQLHKDYLADCNAMCRMVDAKKQEVAAALNDTTNVSPVAHQKLDELAACRAHCQSQMLQYFIAVSRNMPRAEGRRYLAKMQSATLGFQSGTGNSMSDHAGHEHGTN